MLTHTMKRFLFLSLTLSVLAGCASTPEPEPEAVDTSADTTQADTAVDTTAFDAPAELPPLDTTVYFDFDQSIIKPASRALLTAHAERLKDSGDSVRVEGHCDERGTREYNMALGERRANAVRDFLVLQGVSRSSIETVSYGEERPVDTRSTDSAWSQNRRAEIVL